MKRLQYPQRPKGPVDAVLDTDAYNEVDDQFAIAYLFRSTDRVNLKAIYAAPFYDKSRRFFNDRSDSPQQGMERSFEEILKLLHLLHRDDFAPNVYRGADSFLPNETTPVISLAAQDLAKRAMQYSSEHPLYVVAIASPVNVASALLLEPQIADRIVIVFLGGNSYDWPTSTEFNLSQDLAASRVLFASDAPLVQVPCMGVASSFAVAAQELKQFFYGKNDLCTFLAENVFSAQNDPRAERCWSRVIWDVTACAWLTGDAFVRDRGNRRPMPCEDETYHFDSERLLSYVWHIDRDSLLRDLIRKLTLT